VDKVKALFVSFYYP